ncbi:MAG: HigA family addiction module antitoxin [Dehalococcoidia bacterium]
MTLRRPAEVFPPGEFLREELEERGWTQTDLAEILDRPVRVVNEIIAAKRRISPDTAKGLGAAFGTPAEFWLNLESAYQLWRVRNDDDDGVARRARLFTIAPLKEMFRRGWIEASDNIEVLEKRVEDFFEVANLDTEPEFTAYAARKSTGYTSTTPAQKAWLFRARKLARAVYAKAFTRSGIDDALGQLRLLLQSPQEVRHVPRILSEAGIRFVIVEALPGTRIDGASFWQDESPVIALSLRFDRIDCFWHTLMHEIGHVHFGHAYSLDLDLETDQPGAEKPEGERLADDFAIEQLVQKQKLDSFIARVRPLYSSLRVEGFAKTCKVHPGIVVGQLQHRGELAWANLRKMLVPVRTIISEAALTDGWGVSLPAQL